jgi:hypothetical protein
MTEVHIRHAKPTELDRVLDYCRAHENRHFAIRERETRAAITNNGVYIIEVGDQLVGTSSNFLIVNSEQTSQWMEIGQSRITLNGLALYKALICLQALDALRNWPSIEFVFAQVDEVNRKVSEMFASVCFRRFEPSPDLEEACIDTLPMSKRPEALGYGFVWWKVAKRDRTPLQNILEDFVARFPLSSGGKYTLVMHDWPRAEPGPE